MEERECMLCGRAEADPDIFGIKEEEEDICAHEFCVCFANELHPFLIIEGVCSIYLSEDIERAIWRASEKECFVCDQSGASITCQETGCGRSFHLPCAVRGQCVTQYFGQYRSFCSEHRPQQAVEATPQNKTMCLICTDLVDDTMSYRTMVCPTCRHAWFHRDCIQGHALRAGTSCFRCPLCRDMDGFKEEMLRMGIRIPSRPPAWEEFEEFAALGERHGRCDASECLCPGGREQAEDEGPWKLLLCCSCASEGTHRCCSHLAPGTDNWECQSCAGPSTATTASSEINGASTSSQSGSGPPHGSPARDGSSRSSSLGPDRTRNHSRLQRRTQTPYDRPRRCRVRSRALIPAADTSTQSQAVPEPSHRSQAPDTSSPSTNSQLPLGSLRASPPLETISPSAGSQVPLRDPVLEGSSRSSTPGPVWERVHSRLQRRPQTPCVQPAGRQQNNRAPAPGADTSTRSQAVPGPSHRSRAPDTSSPSTTSQLPSGASSSSPGLESTRRSSRPGPLRLRDRSRSQRQPQAPYSRPGHRRRT